MLALNVVELHGNFNPISEITTNSYSRVSSIAPVVNTDLYSGAEIVIGGKRLLVLQSNTKFDGKTTHQIMINGISYNWEGPFVVYLENKKL